MSEQSDADLREEFADVVDRAATALGDDGDLSEDEAADLRARLERVASDVSEASVSELLAAASVEDEGDADGDEPSLAEALARADSSGVDSLRTLLDVAELGDDAPEDDREFAERLNAIVDGDGGDGEVDDRTEAGDGSDAGDTSGADDGGGADDSGGGDEGPSDGDGDEVTFADVVSGAATLAKNWSDTRKRSADETPADGEDDAGDRPDDDRTSEEADEDEVSEEEDEDEAGEDDEEDDSLFDPDDIKERISGDDDEDSGAGRTRRSRNRRYSTVPSRRSDMGKRRRFSTVKGRK